MGLFSTDVGLASQACVQISVASVRWKTGTALSSTLPLHPLAKNLPAERERRTVFDLREVRPGVAMTIGDICRRHVIVVPKGESIIDAAKRMRMDHVGDVVVVEYRNGSRVPVGILTDRDIVLSIVASDPEHLAFLTVGDAMSSDLVTAQDDLGIADAFKVMKDRGVRRLPVVNADGALVGVVTSDDLLRFLASEVESLVQLITREQEFERRLRV
jgi:CBS domain-containing protein